MLRLLEVLLAMRVAAAVETGETDNDPGLEGFLETLGALVFEDDSVLQRSRQVLSSHVAALERHL